MVPSDRPRSRRTAENESKDDQQHEAKRITVGSPAVKDVTLTEQYVCKIHSHRHIKVRALQKGYLEAIPVKEGQQVKAGDLLFQVIPILYQKKAEAEKAEAKLAQLELNDIQEAVRGQSGL